MYSRCLVTGSLVVCAVFTASAQAPKPQGAAPAAKEVLFSAADSIGMLRTAAEVDRIATMNYWATGTMTADGKTCKLKEYKASVNWLQKGMRSDYTCDGQARRVEVVNGAASWNETEPGVNPSSAATAGAERQLMIWTLPAGVIKAAAAAGSNATVSVENGRTVLSFPVADVTGATIRATYSQETYLLERVEARLGTTALDISYADYGDWNGDDYLSDVQFPKRIVQKRGNATVLDLTVTKTNTYNPYVVMPVPPGMKAQR